MTSSLLPVLLLVFFAAAAPDEHQDTREALVERINAVRRAAGVRPLKLSAPLTAVAQARADEVAAGRGSKQPATEEDLRRAGKAGYDARLISEVEALADGNVERSDRSDAKARAGACRPW